MNLIEERALPATGPSDAIAKRTAQLRYNNIIGHLPRNVRPVIEAYVAILERSVLDEWARWTRIHERELLLPEDVVASRMAATNVGYLDVANIKPGVPAEFHKHLVRLLEDGARSIIVDLRDNGGSTPEDAVRIVSEFIATGTIVKLRGHETRTYDATPGGTATDPDIEVIVLQNRFSASGAEVVAAALKHHDRATIIGEPSFAKTWVWRRAPDGTETKTGDWLDPTGRSVGPRGVQPHLVVADVDDAILTAALDRLNDVAN